MYIVFFSYKGKNYKASTQKNEFEIKKLFEKKYPQAENLRVEKLDSWIETILKVNQNSDFLDKGE